MANGFNEFIVTGNIGRAPEMSYSQQGVAVTRFSMAYNDKDTTTWLKCVAFRDTAERINEWCQKGTGLLVSGTLHFRIWHKDDGTDVQQFEVIVEKFKVLGGGVPKAGNGGVTVEEIDDSVDKAPF